MKGTWSIGEIAKLFDVSTDALRYYEKAGLLSSGRHGDNGYRYYSYDDIVVIMDILLLRSMEVGVKDIGSVLKTMNLAEIKELLLENDRLVTKRVEALVRQRTLLAQIIGQYERCEQYLGKFSLVPAPDFKCKFWGTQAEDLLHIIRKYKKPNGDWMHSIRYTLRLPREELLKKRSFASPQIGISFDEEILRHLEVSEQQQFAPLPPKECLYTVVGTDYSDRENGGLVQGLAWLKENGRQVEGPLLGRYLASVHKDNLDYYEIWIPLQCS